MGRKVCEDRLVKVGTPLGEYPFEFRRLERRPEGIAIVGLVAGLESSVVVTREDLDLAMKGLAPLLAAAGIIAYFRASTAARFRPM
jgi:hypothetical protein